MNQVEVDHFLNFQNWNLHAAEHVREERGHVVAHGHVGDDLLECHAFLGVFCVALVSRELCPQLLDLACL